MQRKDHANCRSLSHLAFSFNTPAVQLGDMFDDRKTEAGAANAFGAARFVGPIEAFENAREIVLANSDAAIAHAQRDFVVVTLLSVQTNFAVLVRIFHRVIQQIVENLLQARFISTYDRYRRW